MARRALSPREVASLNEHGTYRVDRNLFLQIKPNGAKSWLYRRRVDGKDKVNGLGPLRDISVAEARARADEIRVSLRKGIDPFAQRQAEREAKKAETIDIPTFKNACAQYIASMEAGWRSDKHRAQWSSTLKTYAEPVFGSKPVSDVTRNDVLKVLDPIWRTKPETASRLRGRIEKVLGWAKARGYRTGDNPAQWRGNLEHDLPKLSSIQKIQHRAAIPYAELPALMAELRRRDSESAKALRFTILTGARTGEVVGATWDEFDLEEKVWTIPAGRMKAKRIHRVPLCEEALAIIEGQDRQHKCVFAGSRPNRGLSNMAMLELLRGIRDDGSTVHGMRSGFRDWAAEQTRYPAEVIETALAHATTNKTIAAYLRTDHLDQRRELMVDWGRFLS